MKFWQLFRVILLPILPEVCSKSVSVSSKENSTSSIKQCAQTFHSPKYDFQNFHGAIYGSKNYSLSYKRFEHTIG
jgi:hypothetical protein